MNLWVRRLSITLSRTRQNERQSDCSRREAHQYQSVAEEPQNESRELSIMRETAQQHDETNALQREPLLLEKRIVQWRECLNQVMLELDAHQNPNTHPVPENFATTYDYATQHCQTDAAHAMGNNSLLCCTSTISNHR